jgi:hypothetical protein
MPQASCSCAGWYKPWAWGRPRVWADGMVFGLRKLDFAA